MRKERLPIRAVQSRSPTVTKVDLSRQARGGRRLDWNPAVASCWLRRWMRGIHAHGLPSSSWRPRWTQLAIDTPHQRCPYFCREAQPSCWDARLAWSLVVQLSWM